MNQPPFSTRSGDPMDKTEVLALVEREVRVTEHDLRDEEGRRKFGGHFQDLGSQDDGGSRHQ